MSTTTKAATLSRLTTAFKDKSDKDRLAIARDLHHLHTTLGMKYEEIVQEVTTRDSNTTISTKTISLHLKALRLSGGEKATPETFGPQYRQASKSSRNGTTTADEKATTDGEKKGRASKKETPETVPVTPGNVESVIHALVATITTWSSDDRQKASDLLLDAAMATALTVPVAEVKPTRRSRARAAA